MRIEIEIPVEFESDYRGDKFKDFFSRVLCDIKDGTLCGNYEKETVEMFIKAFEESKIAYDVDKVVEELESAENYYYDDKLDAEGDLIMFKSIEQEVAIEIVRKGSE